MDGNQRPTYGNDGTISWMEIGVVIGPGFAHPKIMPVEQHLCITSNDAPNCSMNVFELDMLRSETSHKKLVDTLPGHLVECRAVYTTHPKTDHFVNNS